MSPPGVTSAGGLLIIDTDKVPFMTALGQLLSAYQHVPIEEVIDELEIQRDALHEESALRARTERKQAREQEQE